MTAPTTPSPISGPGAALTLAIAEPEAAQTMLARVSARKKDDIIETSIYETDAKGSQFVRQSCIVDWLPANQA
jgi:hypothetical protein